MTSCIYLLMECAFRFKIYNIFVYFFKLTSTTAAQVTTFCLFTYGNCLLITCAFRFNIPDLFVYFFKVMSTTAAQVTICFYLLMQMAC